MKTQSPPPVVPLTTAPQLADSATQIVVKLIFFLIVLAGFGFIGVSLTTDLASVPALASASILLLGLALFAALSFEFVNGFHDTANAVATVIYTNALPANVAVVWAGIFNFLGALAASGAVAYGILALLPVELILNVSSGAGYAMIFALLLAAIIWNLGTWYLGIPASSSHTLIGSIIGVGVMNQLLSSSMAGTSGIDMEQVTKVGKALLFSPLIGFTLAAVVFVLMRVAFKRLPQLFEPPVGNTPPPWGIRAVLIFTCTGVSFAHGSNDGQKGMGLIMLILIGSVPVAYSLNQTLTQQQTQSFIQVSQQASQVLLPIASTTTVAKMTAPDPQVARAALTGYIQSHQITPVIVPALAVLATELSQEVAAYGNFTNVPDAKVADLRKDMYISIAALKQLDKQQQMPSTLNAEAKQTVTSYRKQLEQTTQYIPIWVKVAVALALGLGTMVGWKRIVVTVGEKIGKTHLTYAQGMSAELVAMGTILSADAVGMPVSTTHVLNSAVAGTMVANKSGLQWGTIRNILSAWVLTLPVTIVLSGGLYWLFLKFV